jgi:hypothetical protein
MMEELIGKTMTSVEQVNNDDIVFTVDNGTKYKLHHLQDCCEHVYIEDVNGDLNDLVDTPIISAYETFNSETDPEGFVYEGTIEYRESFTWSFYHLATIKGSVVVRFYGQSNGCYGERATLSKEGGRGWDY